MYATLRSTHPVSDCDSWYAVVNEHSTRMHTAEL